MGYSLRSWDYRYTLWLGFNPTTFQVGAAWQSSLLAASSNSFIPPMWSYQVLTGDFSVCDPSMLSYWDAVHDVNKLHFSTIHLPSSHTHTGKCNWCPCWRVVHVGRRPRSGQERLQWRWSQRVNEEDGSSSSCKFIFIRKWLVFLPFISDFTICLLPGTLLIYVDCESADENEAAAPLPHSRDENE